MRARSRFRWSLVAAIAAHGVLTWRLGIDRSPAPGAPRPTSAGATELAIEVERAVQPESPSVAEPAAPRSAPASVTRAADVPHVGTITTPVGSPASSAPAAASAPAPAGTDGTWSFSPGASTDGGALSPEALARAERAGVGALLAQEEARAAATRPSQKIYTPQDVALGLAPGGQFVPIVRDAVRTSLAPDVGRALLEFDTNAAGVVVSVHVLDVSSGREEWNQIAASLANDAKARRPERVPAGALGVAVLLEVTSAIKTVSGATPSDNVLTAIASAINSPAEAIVDAKNPARRIVAVQVVGVRAL